MGLSILDEVKGPTPSLIPGPKVSWEIVGPVPLYCHKPHELHREGIRCRTNRPQVFILIFWLLLLHFSLILLFLLLLHNCFSFSSQYHLDLHHPGIVNDRPFWNEIVYRKLLLLRLFEVSSASSPIRRPLPPSIGHVYTRFGVLFTLPAWAQRSGIVSAYNIHFSGD